MILKSIYSTRTCQVFPVSVTMLSSAGKDVCWKDINLNKYVRTIFWDVNRWKLLFLILPALPHGGRIWFSCEVNVSFSTPEVKISALSGLKERGEWKGSRKIKSVAQSSQEREDRILMASRSEVDVRFCHHVGQACGWTRAPVPAWRGGGGVHVRLPVSSIAEPVDWTLETRP